MAPDTYENAARRLWRTFERDGLEAMLRLVSDDVTWAPLGNRGQPIVGAEALRRYFADMERAGRSASATAYRFEEHGTCVLISGSLRELDTTGLRDSQPTWVYFFDEHKQLRRAVGFRTRVEALAAIDEHCGKHAEV